MAGRKGRTLNAQERGLWEKVVERATPLPKARTQPVQKPALKNHVSPPEPEDLKSHVRLPEDFTVGARSSTQGQPVLPPAPSAPALRMDKKNFGRMTRGKLKPEARIDLHGMTLAQAHPALTRFVLSAHDSGKRLVLVITGKGRGQDSGGPIPARPGALRRQVPLWLGAAPLSQAVLQVTEAHQRHGGSGAYYVYLRRQR